MESNQYWRAVSIRPSARLNGAHRGMATHIPGYYYDVDKNRYFKITSERPAPPRPQRVSSLLPSTGTRVTCKVTSPR